MNRPKVDIVIPSWFTPNQHGKYGKHETFWLANECLKRLRDVTPKEGVSIILVDDSSTLTDADVIAAGSDYAGCSNLRSDTPVFDYFMMADASYRNETNSGFAKSCNNGFDLAFMNDPDYIVCLNNDILVWSGWLDALLEPFGNDTLSPPPGAVMPALIRETSDAREAIGLESPSLKQNAGKIGVRAEFGSLWAAPAQVLARVAGLRDGHQVFHEGFVNGKEDRLLWAELRHLGYETYRTHATRVFHQGQMSCAKKKDRKTFSDANAKLLESEKAKLNNVK